MKKTINILMVIILTSCAEFLDERPNKNIVVPETLDELQALLDATPRRMNDSPAVHHISSDDFFTNDNGFQGFRNVLEQNAYTWQNEIFEDSGVDWNAPFSQIFYANIVLAGLGNVNPQSSEELKYKEEIKGRALFYRAYAYYNLAICFANYYSVNGLNSDELGIPIKLTSDINETIERGTIKETFDFILEDLLDAVPLLPTEPDFITRPSKLAAHALLSRVFLYLADFQNSLTHSNAALEIRNTLIDYNTLQTNSLYSFNLENPEIVFFNQMISYSWMSSTLSFASQEVYQSYDEQDLRKSIMFRNRGFGINFTGNYTGNFNLFTGLAIDEIILNKTEALVRLGNLEEAEETLKYLLKNRYISDSEIILEYQDQMEFLSMVLSERRKQLLYRGIRWADLKRLNAEGVFVYRLEREIMGVNYALEPNDLRYAIQIPPNEISVSGIGQNPR